MSGGHSQVPLFFDALWETHSRIGETILCHLFSGQLSGFAAFKSESLHSSFCA
jgi:hypothetical protein